MGDDAANQGEVLLVPAPVAVEEKEVVGGTGDTAWLLQDAQGATVGRILWDGQRPYTPPPGVASAVPG